MPKPMQSSVVERRVLTLEEVAELLRVYPSTIYRLLNKGDLPAFKVGSDWRFNQESIEQWLKQLEMQNS